MFIQRLRTPLFAALLIGFGLMLLSLVVPVWAAPQAQFTPFPTPTPGPDGRVVYIVQPNDSWWRIAAIYNLDLNNLLEINDATRDTVLAEGEEVLLGFAGPAEVTPSVGPSPTPASRLPTPTPRPGAGTLCVLIYNDVNGDSLRQEEEVSIPGGAISVSNRAGDFSQTEDSPSGLEPVCFTDLTEGDYNVSVAVPEGYNATTVLNYALKVEPGAETYLDFGAQLSSAAMAEAPTPEGSGVSPILGILGVALLLGGVGVAIYAARLSRSSSRRPAE
jgi:hypothetical protein